MSNKTLLLNLFNLKKGEENTVFLLFIYSFFIGIPYAFLYTTSTSLFLSNFQIKLIPFAYMGGGLISYILWLFYRRLEKKLRFSKLLLLGAIFLFISLSSLVFGYLITENKWFAFLLFIWINVFLFFTGVGFWGIASKVFDLRQGKRLFGLIGSGEILSKVISFFSIPFLLKFLVTEQLLYIVALGLFICICILVVIIKKHRDIFDEPSVGKQEIRDQNHQPRKKGLFEILKNKYFAYIIILAIFPLFSTYFVDFIFLKQTKQQFVTQELVSSFLGIFFGFIAVTEFLLKSFISGRLITKYGMSFSLIVLPALLLLTTVIASLHGSFYGITTMFFSFVVLSKLFVRVLRTSFLDPSFQILYQPIPSGERLAFQSQVEGVPKSFGNILAGVVLLLFANIKALTVVHYNIIFIAIILLWLWISYKLYIQYKETLKDTLLRKESDDILDLIDGKLNFINLCELIETGPQKNFNLIYNIILQIEPRQSNAFLQMVMESAPDETKIKILKQIETRMVLPARKYILQYLEEYPNIPNKDSFYSAINTLSAFDKEDFGKLSELTSSGDANERYLAALLMEYSGRFKIYQLLITLLQDEDPKVRKAALFSSGKLRKIELWPSIIQNLFIPTYSTQAISAIKMIGEPILAELDRYFDKINTTRDVKLKIISIYASIKGDKSLNLLRSRIRYPDESIRHQVFQALSKMEYRPKPLEISMIKEIIDEEIAITVWIFAAILDIQQQNNNSFLEEALQCELVQKKENVFLLLSMLYDSKVINFITEIFKTGGNESKAYAIEILDLTVSTEIKEVFLPLLEELTLEESLHFYQDKYPQQKMTIFERLKDIINKDYLKINRWTKACAILSLEEFRDNESILLSNLLNPDPFIMQNSATILSKHNPDRFNALYHKLDKAKATFIDKYTPHIKNGLPEFLLSDMVNLAKKNSLFQSFPSPDIARMIENSTIINLEANEEVIPVKVAPDSLFFVLSGVLSLYSNNQELRHIRENEYYWGIVSDNEEEIILRAEKVTTILIMSPELIFITMSNNSEYTQEVIEILSKIA